jgi:hypothetical protein
VRKLVMIRKRMRGSFLSPRKVRMMFPVDHSRKARKSLLSWTFVEKM